MSEEEKKAELAALVAYLYPRISPNRALPMAAVELSLSLFLGVRMMPPRCECIILGILPCSAV